MLGLQARNSSVYLRTFKENMLKRQIGDCRVTNIFVLILSKVVRKSNKLYQGVSHLRACLFYQIVKHLRTLLQLFLQLFLGLDMNLLIVKL